MTRAALFGGLAAFGATLVAGPPGAIASPSDDLAPILSGTTWLNGRAGRASLAGRVVLVDVFTFECVNCTRVTPNLKKLYGAYSRENFEIVAVHTPEVPAYQSRTEYLKRQIEAASIRWPVVVDNDYAIWRAYGVSAWPTQLIFDRHGRFLTRVVGDSQDDAVDAAVRRALASNERHPGK